MVSQYVSDVWLMPVMHSPPLWQLYQVTIALLLTIFGVAHSGLASLRPFAEDIIGARVRTAHRPPRPTPPLAHIQTSYSNVRTGTSDAQVCAVRRPGVWCSR